MVADFSVKNAHSNRQVECVFLLYRKNQIFLRIQRG